MLPAAAPPAPAPPEAWWSRSTPELFAALASGPEGLTGAEAGRRAARHGPNEVRPAAEVTAWRLWARQFASPLVMILLAGSLVSLLLRDWVDTAVIVAILLLGALLGFWQEWRASTAIARLRGRLATKARVWRDGRLEELPTQALVPGDVVELSAGKLVPGDGVVIAARDCQVDQSSLTGESFPVDKRPGPVDAGAPLAARGNCVHLGSAVRSGTASVLLVRTGRDSLLAEVAARIATPDTETDFERGVRRFGELLLRVMLGVVVCVLAVNAALGRPVVDSLLFAVALAVGMSPELLPAIVGVSLARGARRLAAVGVLVRRLDAIEDLGAIDVLCTDKTGTLTSGVMTLAAALDPAGRPSAAVQRLAFLNATFQSGIDNPIDAALVAAGRAAGLDTAGWRRIDEIPYDFSRRRLSVIVAADDAPAAPLLITKGAVDEVLSCCTIEAGRLEALRAFVRERGERGQRVLALASRRVASRSGWSADDERGLQLEGFLCFEDPPKPDAAAAVAALQRRGVRVAIVSGDNRHVAAALAARVGLDPQACLTGGEIAALGDEALWHRAEHTALFVEVDPAQKERIVRALQRTGHAVGYLGDGINDGPALHAADVGVSVDHATDVARESADIVLLKPDLAVLERGIAEGRRTFANTLKYIRITVSANFGNMVSMALATPLLPFLPMTATQILLNNFLSDLPALALSGDRVEPEGLLHAPRWDLRDMQRFMLLFGLLSTAFDLLTFVVLRQVFDVSPALFQSGWFVVSLLTELVVLLVLRTRRALWRGRPSGLLLGLAAAVAAVALALPWLGPLARALGLQPLPPALLGALLGIVVAYAAATEAVKRVFWRRHRARPGRR